MFKKLTLTAVAAVFCVSAGFGDEVINFWRPRTKKVLYFGWERISPFSFSRYLKSYEKAFPVQGVTIRFNGKTADGRMAETNFPYSPEQDKGKYLPPVRWDENTFKRNFELMKQVRSTKFTDNFIGFTTREGNYSLFSDSDWAIICNNVGILAKMAREIGCKGLVFDSEYYSHRMVKAPFALDPKHSYAENMRKWRQRGQEWGRAIFKEFPQAKILFYFLFADFTGSRNQKDPVCGKIAFVNGVYDVLPPEAEIIAGHEHHGYAACDEAAIMALRNDVTMLYPRFVDVKNLDKFRNQTKFAAALYFDTYAWFKPGAKPHDTFSRHLYPEFEKYGMLPVLRRNVHAALQMSDEYLWIWAEGGRWLPGRRQKPWPNGMREVLECAVDPLAYARNYMKNNPKSANVIRHGTFKAGLGENKSPKNWSFWCRNKSAKFQLTSDGVVVTGPGSSTFLSQTVSGVKPWQLYYVRARVKASASARIGVYATFKNSALNRFALNRYADCGDFGAPDANGVRTAEVVFMIPTGVDQMLCHFNLSRLEANENVTLLSMEAYLINDIVEQGRK